MRIQKQIEAAETILLPQVSDSSRREYLEGLYNNIRDAEIDESDIVALDKENESRRIEMNKILETRKSGKKHKKIRRRGIALTAN